MWRQLLRSPLVRFSFISLFVMAIVAAVLSVVLIIGLRQSAKEYSSFAPLANLLGQQQRLTILVVASSFLVLYLSLVSVVRRGWIIMDSQKRRLEQKDQEVKAVAELSAKTLTEKAALEEGVQRQKERLARLSVAMTLAQGSPGPIELGRQMLGLVQQEIGAEYASLTLVNPDGSAGEHLDRFNGMQPFDASSDRARLTEAVLKNGKTQYLTEAPNAWRVGPAPMAAGMRSCIGLPLRSEGQTIGVLCFHSARPHAFDDDRLFLESFAGICAMPLQRERLLSRIEQAKEELETTFDAVPNAVVLIDENRQVLRANLAFSQLVNKPVQSVPGSSLCKLVHGKDEFLHRCPFEESMANTGQARTFREPYLGNISLSVRMYPVTSSPGEPRRYVAFLTVRN